MSAQKIPRLSDRQLIAKLLQVRDEILGGVDFDFTLHAFDTHVGTFNTAGLASGAIKFLLDADGSGIENLSATLIAGIGFNYHRGGTNAPKSAYFDEVLILIGQQHPDRFELGSKLLKILRPYEFSGTGLDGLLDVEAVRAIQEETLNRLERLHEDGIRRVQATQGNLEEAHRQQQATLDEDFSRRRKSLESTYATQKSALEQLESELKARSDQLDDRDNTHARRDNRQRMLNDVKERFQNFGVTATTAQKREPVRWGILALITIFTVFAIMSWAEVFLRDTYLADIARSAVNTAAATAASSADTPASGAKLTGQNPILIAMSADGTQYFLWIRTGLLTIGVIASILYYIRWQNAWAEQHSRSEFALQQFHIDVNRANWVMESCLEWHKTTGSPISDSLVAAFTRSLFAAGDSTAPQAIHPADELASALIGSASKLKLKAGEHEIEFNKPGKIPKHSSAQKTPAAT